MDMMDIAEIQAKAALTKSKIPGVEYVINPYIGCGHGCRYCYAAFMSKWSRHHAGSEWGSFVEPKVNIAEVLQGELSRKRKRGTVLLSSACDPYQPVEARFRLTRECILLLDRFGWGIDILTRSPLVTRDIDLLRSGAKVSVGFSIPTDSDRVREVLEPRSPSIAARLQALRELHGAGIETWVFIAPLLPLNPEKLHEAVAPYVSHVMMDRLNYPEKVRSLLYEKGWGYALTESYAKRTASELAVLFGEKSARIAGHEKAVGAAPPNVKT